MRSVASVLLSVMIVSSLTQSWAAPMLCQSEMDMRPAAAGHAHDAGEEHHANMHHDPAAHEQSADHDHSSSKCTSDCECSDCVITVVLCDELQASVTAYGCERTTLRDHNRSLILNTIFRPPISA